MAKRKSPLGNHLDPTDWAAFRAAAHDVLDHCIDRMGGAADHPWQPVPADVAAGYGIEDAALGEVEVARRMVADVLPYGTGNTHPCFFGWVHGTGLASGLISEMVAATMNSNCGGRDHGAVYMERAVIDWSKSVFGYPETASGLLVAGTSQATVIALSAARLRVLPHARRLGNTAHLVAYAGAGVHNATRKAIELIGVGADNLRLIPQDENGLDLTVLRSRIKQDRADGLVPFAIIGTAGSVDRGGFDDLNGLADIARDLDVWLHIDGAFGAWLAIADDPWRGLVDGIGRADSIACDFHKWMYVQYDCGMVLIRKEDEHRAAFAARPAYLEGQARGLAGGDPWYCDYGIDLSRGNRGLKVWAALKAYGREGLGRAISDNCRLAALMGQMVDARAPMQIVAPIVSNICVFTADGGLDDRAESALNTRIAQELQISGEAVFSTTMIGGVTCLRAAITNHRTTQSYIELAIEAVVKAVG